MSEKLIPYGTTVSYSVDTVVNAIGEIIRAGGEQYKHEDLRSQIEDELFTTDLELDSLISAAIRFLARDEIQDGDIVAGLNLIQGFIVATILYSSESGTLY